MVFLFEEEINSIIKEYEVEALDLYLMPLLHVFRKDIV